MSEKKVNKSATVALVGDTSGHYQTVLAEMVSILPGIKPNSADVLRHALHLAAGRIEQVEIVADIFRGTESKGADDE